MNRWWIGSETASDPVGPTSALYHAPRPEFLVRTRRACAFSRNPQPPHGFLQIFTQVPAGHGRYPGWRKPIVRKRASSEQFRALIFAEGGSRELRPLTDHLPTSLLPIGGTPILDRQVQALLAVGVEEIIVVGGYRAAQIEQATRVYSGVEFRYNPHFSRGEPTLTALAAAGSLEGRPTLLARGELSFDRNLLSDLLDADAEDALAVDSKGGTVGLYRLGSATATALGEACEDSMARGEADRDLFTFVEALSGTYEHVTANGHGWARIGTMSDLAKALAASRADRVASDGEPQAPGGPEDSAFEPGFLPRTLLKVVDR